MSNAVADEAASQWNRSQLLYFLGSKLHFGVEVDENDCALRWPVVALKQQALLSIGRPFVQPEEDDIIPATWHKGISLLWGKQLQESL